MSEGFEFLRPAWLLALLLLPLFAWRTHRPRSIDAALREAVDAHLLDALVVRRDGTPSRLRHLLAGAAFAVGVVALAGPSWRSSVQPLWQSRAPVVLAVDLSSAMLADDLPPSRLAQLRARLRDALQATAGAPVALVAFAGDAYTVAPLTDDVANITLFLDALAPDVMPGDGHAVDRAIAWSAGLLERAGQPSGRIIVFSDGADARAHAAARAARSAGYTVSAVGLGTRAGAVVATSQRGAVTARLDEAALQRLATEGGGRYARLGQGDLELVAPAAAQGVRATDGGRVREDNGAWLLPWAMGVALLAWLRTPRGAALVLLLAVMPATRDAQAQWLREDQSAHRRSLQALEAYRKGDHARAAQIYAQVPGAVGHYNRGNALAKAGQLQQALAAYDAALAARPGMRDAVANRAAVAAALRRQQAGQGDRPGQRGAGGEQGGRQGGQPARQDGDGAERGGAGRPAPDPAAQARADAAQRQRMQAAVDRAARAQGKPTRKPQASPAERERRIANEAALRRIPDEPGNLLREKFRLEQARRQREGGP